MGDRSDQLDLEKELSCSICTDIFYQPLTLLDCLHTFCGSCLKEWFSWQASAATTQHPYTCPACRAAVRDTKPNATVTTLLDMLLRAHPDRAKTQQEKDQIEKTYKPGDNVMPPVATTQDSDDSEDERMLEEARGLSLEDGGADRRPYTPTSAASHVRHRRRHDPARVQHHQQQRRNLDHQSSLRSILSASEPDEIAIQDDIMRQIMDDGLLDGVDLNNLTPAQEDEITERIAHAFRARQREQHSSRRRARESPRQASGEVESSRRSLRHVASSRQSSRDAESSRQSSRDYSSRQRTRDGRARAHAPRESQSNDSRQSQANDSNQRRHIWTEDRTVAPEPSTPSRRRTSSQPGQTSSSFPSVATRSDETLVLSPTHLQPATRRVRLGDASLSHLGRRTTDPESRPNSEPVSNPVVRLPILVPSLACSTCKKADIQTSIHYNCAKCAQGQFNLCLTCYRAGKGCFHYYGFGYAAFARYDRSTRSESASPNHEKPHVLLARRYRQPSGVLDQGLFCDVCFSFADDCYWHCDICNEGAWGFCNDCVQKAKHCTHPLQCIENVSVPRNRPYTVASHPRPPPLDGTIKSLRNSDFTPRMSAMTLPNVVNPSDYAALTLAVYCDLCQRSIPPSHTRYHCHICNQGNYDICASCYHTAGSTGRMKPEDGAQGWRRCPRGHRMSVIGFEDREGGPRRIVVRNFVGGWALKEDGPRVTEASQSGPNPAGQWRWKEEDGSSASQLSATRQVTDRLMPPDGGVGLRTQALWSHFPTDGVQDELAFPRHAVISEVEDINGDWYWGVYAGSKGLFPGNYVRII